MNLLHVRICSVTRHITNPKAPDHDYQPVSSASESMWLGNHGEQLGDMRGEFFRGHWTHPHLLRRSVLLFPKVSTLIWVSNYPPPTPYGNHTLNHPPRLPADMIVGNSPATSGGKATYTCQVCHRAYERLDHLNRHLDSRN
jgi:hypothetical protein